MYNIFSFEQGCFNLNAPGAFKRYLVVLLFFSAMLYFSGLPIQEFSGADEPRVAGIGTEFALGGDMVVPRLNGKPFLEMPPMFYWAEAWSFKLFGFNNEAARLPSAVAGMWGVIVCFLLAARLGLKPFTCFCSALVLAMAPQFWANGRTAMVDMMLASFTVTAVYGYYSCALAECWKKKILWMLLFALAAGGGIMTKGLIGLAVPGAAIGSWLFFENIVKRRVSWANWVWMFVGAILSFVPLAIWAYFLNRELGWDAGGKIVLYTNNIGRFFGQHNDHNEPLYYYLKKSPEIFQPWLIFTIAGFLYFARRFFQGKNTAYLLMLCYAVFPLALLNISSVKRMVYLLPTNPALALLAGGFIGLLLQGEIKLHEKINLRRVCYWLSILVGSAGIIFFTIAALFPVIAKFAVRDIQIFGFCGLLLSAMALLMTIKREFGRAATMLLLVIVILFSIINIFRAEAVNRKEAFRPMFNYVAAYVANGKELMLLSPIERIRGAAVFYLQRLNIAVSESPAELLRRTQAAPGKYIVLCGENEIPANWRILKTFKIKKDVYALVVPLENKP